MANLLSVTSQTGGGRRRGPRPVRPTICRESGALLQERALRPALRRTTNRVCATGFPVRRERRAANEAIPRVISADKRDQRAAIDNVCTAIHVPELERVSDRYQAIMVCHLSQRSRVRLPAPLRDSRE